MVELASKRVTVMGLGRFGGGIGVSRWLAAQGADVLITDVQPAEELAASVEAIRALVDSGQVRLRLGEHNVSDFTTADLVVANPAVPKPWENRFLRAAAASGVEVTTEIQMVFERLPNRQRVIGITGSVGKSTTTAMIAHALRAAGGEVHVGGNIGGSLLDVIERADPGDWFVVELSSFMLYWLESLFARGVSVPHVAVVTNISPNHVDWHASVSHYESCKEVLYKYQDRNDVVIFGPTLGDRATRCEQRCCVVDPSAYNGRLSVPGAHNIENAATAVAACMSARPDVPGSVFEGALGTFAGLPHRLQLAREVVVSTTAGAGAKVIRFYNDSKSTTPESTLRAVDAVAGMEGMSRSRVHLIAGGYDKQSDLSPISALGRWIGGLYTIGATGPAIASAADEGAPVHDCGTLANAVRVATTRLRPGDVLLLSPGCASWDQYTNYEERGNEFLRLVEAAVGSLPKAR